MPKYPQRTFATHSARIGSVLRAARESVDLSVYGAAPRVGLDQNVLTRIERGDRPCRVTELVAIASAYGYDPAWMLRTITSGRKIQAIPEFRRSATTAGRTRDCSAQTRALRLDQMEQPAIRKRARKAIAERRKLIEAGDIGPTGDQVPDLVAIIDESGEVGKDRPNHHPGYLELLTRVVCVGRRLSMHPESGQRPCGATDSAADFYSAGCGFESCRGHSQGPLKNTGT